MIAELFLKCSADRLDQLRGRIHDCVGRLDDGQVWLRHSGNENAIGNLVLHLCGNVRQWIGHAVAGNPDQRDRDSEFDARGGLGKADLLHKLDEVVDAAVNSIRTLPPARLEEQTEVQKYHVTILEVIYHVVEHFAQHTAQIIFATKLLTGQDLGYYKHLSHAGHGKTTP